MSKKKEKELDKRMFKKSPEELEQYLHFKKRGFAIDNKKGKGSYTRKTKHKKSQHLSLFSINTGFYKSCRKRDLNPHDIAITRT